MNNNEKIDQVEGRNFYERVIIGCEKEGIIQIVIECFVLIILIGYNSHIRGEYDKGLIFIIFFLLIFKSGLSSATKFFGTSALAILVIIHSLVFGVNMITLVIAFGFFVVFKKKFEKSFFLTILCYLSVDTLVILSNIDSLLSSYLVSIGKGIFTSAKFYSITGVFVLTYFYVIIERYLYDVFESKFLKKYGALLFLFFILIFSIFMFKRHNVNFLEYAIGPLLAIFFIGVLLFKKTFKELLLVSILCIILISVTVLLADECQMISKEKTSCFKFFLIDSF